MQVHAIPQLFVMCLMQLSLLKEWLLKGDVEFHC